MSPPTACATPSPSSPSNVPTKNTDQRPLVLLQSSTSLPNGPPLTDELLRKLQNERLRS